MIEEDLKTWLGTLQAGLRTFYQHLLSAPPRKFIWFRRAGDESLDTIDGTGEPDIIYFDVEVYAETLTDLTTLCAALRTRRDYRGVFGSARVEDVQIQDQQDDYEPKASADSLPEFMSSFRLIVTGYE